MEETYFPPLDDDSLWALEVIKDNLKENPGYLSDEMCPYPQWLRDWWKKEPREVSDVVVEEVDLVAETTVLFSELREAKANFQDDDHAERMSYFRVSTSLLEKLVSLKERALNVRQVSRFYSTVIAVMEEFLEPGQITQIRERLKEYSE